MDRSHNGSAGTCGGHMALSARQAEILQLVAAGFTAEAAAERLGIARSTVEDHLRAMRRQTCARNCPELVARAYVAGIFVPGSWPPRLALADAAGHHGGPMP